MNEIAYPFPINGTAIEVWEWMSNNIPQFTEQMIIKVMGFY